MSFVRSCSPISADDWIESIAFSFQWLFIPFSTMSWAWYTITPKLVKWERTFHSLDQFCFLQLSSSQVILFLGKSFSLFQYLTFPTSLCNGAKQIKWLAIWYHLQYLFYRVSVRVFCHLSKPNVNLIPIYNNFSEVQRSIIIIVQYRKQYAGFPGSSLILE